MIVSSAYSLHKSLPYDTLSDFAAVIPVGKTPTVLVTAPAKGFKTAGDLIRRQSETGRDELRFRRRRQRVASGRRAVSPERRHRRAAHPLQGAERSIHGSDGRADRFLFSAVGAGAAAGQGGAVDRTRGQHRYAGDCPARCAYHDGAGPEEYLVPDLDRRLRSAKTPRDIIGKLHDESRRPCRCRRCRSGSRKPAPSPCR